MNFLNPLGFGHIKSIIKSVLISREIMGLRIEFLNLGTHPTIKKDDVFSGGFGKRKRHAIIEM